MQEVGERIGKVIVGAFGCMSHALADIAQKINTVRCARDRLSRYTKIIRAIDRQTKTISMPNAVAIAARLKNASTLMRSLGSNGFLTRLNGCINRVKSWNGEWIVTVKQGFM